MSHFVPQLHGITHVQCIYEKENGNFKVNIHFEVNYFLVELIGTGFEEHYLNRWTCGDWSTWDFFFFNKEMNLVVVQSSPGHPKFHKVSGLHVARASWRKTIILLVLAMPTRCCSWEGKANEMLLCTDAVLFLQGVLETKAESASDLPGATRRVWHVSGLRGVLTLSFVGLNLLILSGACGRLMHMCWL